jgi:hypothetical protein
MAPTGKLRIEPVKKLNTMVFAVSGTSVLRSAE